MKPESGQSSHVFLGGYDLPDVLKDIEGVLRSGQLILGPHTKELEKEFATFIGTKHAVALSSCTAALEIALEAAADPLKPEVIVPTNTFSATAAAVYRTNRTNVLCEIHPNDYCLDVGDVITKVTDQTSAIIVVHLAGFIPHGMSDLKDFCSTKNITLIEDCAHAHGAMLGKDKAGSLGDIGCFSFYPTKIMTCGVGGMLTTNDPHVDKVAREIRHHGAEGNNLLKIVRVGADYLMDEVRAVLARSQLKHLPDMLQRRRAVADAYAKALAPTTAEPAIAATGVTPSYYKYPVTLPAEIPNPTRKIDRGLVQERLKTRGIHAAPLYHPLVHMMDAFTKPEMEKSERIIERQLCLPMHTAVAPSDCFEIVKNLVWAMDY